MRTGTLTVAFALLVATASAAWGLDEQAYLAKFLQAHPTHLQAWNRMVATGPAPQWLGRYLDMHGAEAPAVAVDVAGVSYKIFTTCKPHDCFTQFAVTFSPDGGTAWGAMADYGAEPRYFGLPDIQTAQALREALQAR